MIDLEGRLRLKQLSLVQAIKETGSLRRAAEHLNITQSGATKSLRDLENNLGVKLFDRSRAGMCILPTGEAFASSCSIILSDVRSAVEGLHELAEGKSGQVIVGFLSSAQSLVPDALSLMLETRPNVSIHLVDGATERLVTDLMQGEIDLLVGRLPSPRPRQTSEEEVLYEDPICLVCRAGHPLSHLDEVGWKDLLSYRWVLPEEGTHGRRYVNERYQGLDLDPPTPLVVTSSPMTRLALLMSTEMIGVLAERSARAFSRSKMLHMLPLSLGDHFPPVGVVTRRGAILSPATKAFRDALRHVARHPTISA